MTYRYILYVVTMQLLYVVYIQLLYFLFICSYYISYLYVVLYLYTIFPIFYSYILYFLFTIFPIILYIVTIFPIYYISYLFNPTSVRCLMTYRYFFLLVDDLYLVPTQIVCDITRSDFLFTMTYQVKYIRRVNLRVGQSARSSVSSLSIANPYSYSLGYRRCVKI